MGDESPQPNPRGLPDPQSPGRLRLFRMRVAMPTGEIRTVLVRAPDPESAVTRLRSANRKLVTIQQLSTPFVGKRDRVAPAFCFTCGYSLEGTPRTASGAVRCPECGTVAVGNVADLGFVRGSRFARGGPFPWLVVIPGLIAFGLAILLAIWCGR